MNKLSRYLKKKKKDFPSILILDHNTVPKVQLNISKQLVLLSLLSSEAGQPKPFSGFQQMFDNSGGLYSTYDFHEVLQLLCEWLLLFHFPIHSPTDILQESST